MATRDEATKRTWLIIQFRYGSPAAPTFTNYTDYTSDIQVGQLTFSSAPAIKAQIPPLTGAFKEQSLRLEMPEDDFLKRISNGEPHSPIFVSVVETLDVASLASSSRQLDTLFKGRVTKAVRNFNKTRKLVGVFAQNWKSFLTASLGFPALNECVLDFGGKGCRVVVPSVSARVTEITDNRITLLKTDGVSPLDAVPNRQWHRGKVVRDGLEINVRDWANVAPENPNHFYLDDFPPTDWLNQNVTLFGGCSRSIASCRFWGNELNFDGIGIAIPARNPVLESGV